MIEVLRDVLPHFSTVHETSPNTRTFWASLDSDTILRAAHDPQAVIRAVTDIFLPVLRGAEALGKVIRSTLGTPWRDMNNWLGARCWYPVYVTFEDNPPEQQPAPFSLGPLAYPVDPNIADPAALFREGLDALGAGDYQKGLPLYEYRWLSDKGLTWWPDLEFPMWAGAGSSPRLLVHTEQGYGDIIHFSRYLKALNARGIDADLLVAPNSMGMNIARLLSSIDFGGSLINRDDAYGYDAQIPLCSLPLGLGCFSGGLEGLLSDPYIHVRSDLLGKWRERTCDASPLVGLCWAGNPGHQFDSDRSMSLTDLLAYLPRLRDPRLISLQMGNERKQAAGLPVADWTDELEDFADTAALIHDLDLVLTVDTSIAHLAGAMGKETIMVVGEHVDWRWQPDVGGFSRWYPSVRITPRAGKEIMPYLRKPPLALVP